MTRFRYKYDDTGVLVKKEQSNILGDWGAEFEKVSYGLRSLWENNRPVAIFLVVLFPGLILYFVGNLIASKIRFNKRKKALELKTTSVPPEDQDEIEEAAKPKRISNDTAASMTEKVYGNYQSRWNLNGQMLQRAFETSGIIRGNHVKDFTQWIQDVKSASLTGAARTAFINANSSIDTASPAILEEYTNYVMQSNLSQEQTSFEKDSQSLFDEYRWWIENVMALTVPEADREAFIRNNTGEFSREDVLLFYYIYISAENPRQDDMDYRNYIFFKAKQMIANGQGANVGPMISMEMARILNVLNDGISIEEQIAQMEYIYNTEMAKDKKARVLSNGELRKLKKAVDFYKKNKAKIDQEEKDYKAAILGGKSETPEAELAAKQMDKYFWKYGFRALFGVKCGFGNRSKMRPDEAISYYDTNALFRSADYIQAYDSFIDANISSGQYTEEKVQNTDKKSITFAGHAGIVPFRSYIPHSGDMNVLSFSLKNGLGLLQSLTNLRGILSVWLGNLSLIAGIITFIQTGGFVGGALLASLGWGALVLVAGLALTAGIFVLLGAISKTLQKNPVSKYYGVVTDISEDRGLSKEEREDGKDREDIKTAKKAMIKRWIPLIAIKTVFEVYILNTVVASIMTLGSITTMSLAGIGIMSMVNPMTMIFIAGLVFFSLYVKLYNSIAKATKRFVARINADKDKPVINPESKIAKFLPAIATTLGSVGIMLGFFALMSIATGPVFLLLLSLPFILFTFLDFFGFNDVLKAGAILRQKIRRGAFVGKSWSDFGNFMFKDYASKGDVAVDVESEEYKNWEQILKDSLPEEQYAALTQDQKIELFSKTNTYDYTQQEFFRDWQASFLSEKVEKSLTDHQKEIVFAMYYNKIIESYFRESKISREEYDAYRFVISDYKGEGNNFDRQILRYPDLSKEPSSFGARQLFYRLHQETRIRAIQGYRTPELRDISVSVVIPTNNEAVTHLLDNDGKGGANSESLNTVVADGHTVLSHLINVYSGEWSNLISRVESGVDFRGRQKELTEDDLEVIEQMRQMMLSGNVIKGKLLRRADGSELPDCWVKEEISRWADPKLQPLSTLHVGMMNLKDTLSFLAELEYSNTRKGMSDEQWDAEAKRIVSDFGCLQILSGYQSYGAVLGNGAFVPGSGKALDDPRIIGLFRNLKELREMIVPVIHPREHSYDDYMKLIDLRNRGLSTNYDKNLIAEIEKTEIGQKWKAGERTDDKIKLVSYRRLKAEDVTYAQYQELLSKKAANMLTTDDEALLTAIEGEIAKEKAIYDRWQAEGRETALVSDYERDGVEAIFAHNNGKLTTVVFDDSKTYVTLHYGANGIMGQGKVDHHAYLESYITNKFIFQLDMNQGISMQSALSIFGALQPLLQDDEVYNVSLQEKIPTERLSGVGKKGALAEYGFNASHEDMNEMFQLHMYGHPNFLRTSFIQSKSGQSKSVVSEDATGGKSAKAKGGKTVDAYGYSVDKTRETWIIGHTGMVSKFAMGSAEMNQSPYIHDYNQTQRKAFGIFGGIFAESIDFIEGPGFYVKEKLVVPTVGVFLFAILFMGISGFSGFSLAFVLAALGLVLSQTSAATGLVAKFLEYEDGGKYSRFGNHPILNRIYNSFGDLGRWAKGLVANFTYFVTQIKTHHTGQGAGDAGKAAYVGTGRGSGLGFVSIFKGIDSRAFDSHLAPATSTILLIAAAFTFKFSLTLGLSFLYVLIPFAFILGQVQLRNGFNIYHDDASLVAKNIWSEVKNWWGLLFNKPKKDEKTGKTPERIPFVLTFIVGGTTLLTLFVASLPGLIIKGLVEFGQYLAKQRNSKGGSYMLSVSPILIPLAIVALPLIALVLYGYNKQNKISYANKEVISDLQRQIKDLQSEIAAGNDIAKDEINKGLDNNKILENKIKQLETLLLQSYSKERTEQIVSEIKTAASEEEVGEEEAVAVADEELTELAEKVARAKELKASGKLTQTVLDELKETASKVVIKNSDSNEAKIAKVEGLRDFLEVYGFYAGGKHYDYRPIDLIVFELQTKAGFGLLGLEEPSFQNGNITPYSVKDGKTPIVSYDYLQANNEAKNIQNIIYMYLNGGLGESVKGREPVIFALNQFKGIMSEARAANDTEAVEILSTMAKERDLFGRYLTDDQIARLEKYGFIQVNPYDFYDESGKVKKEVVVGKKTIKVPALTGKATDTPFVVKMEDGTYEYRSIMDIKMAEMANHEGIAALQIVGPGGEANATDILKLIEAEESLLDSTFEKGALQTNGKGGGILLQERYYSWKNTGEGFSIDFDNINPGGHGTVFFTLFSSIIPNIRQMCEANGIDVNKLTRQDVEKLMTMSKELFFGNGDGLNSAPTGRIGAATMTTVPRTDVDAKGGMIVALKVNVNGKEEEFPYLLERGNVSDADKKVSEALQELFARYGLKPITKDALAKEAQAYRQANNIEEAETLERLMALFDQYGIKEMRDVRSQAFNTNGIQFNNVLMGLIFVGLIDILGEKETYQLFASPTITSDKGSYTKYEWAIGQVLLWGNMNLEILRRQNPQVDNLLNTILGEGKQMATVVMSSPEQREEAGFTPFKFVKDILLFFKGGFINLKNKFSFNEGTKTDVLGVTGASENNLFSVYYDWAYFDNEAESFVAKGDIAANHVIVRGKVELINESGKHVDVSPELMKAYGLSEENGKVVLENITVRIDKNGNMIVSQDGKEIRATSATEYEQLISKYEEQFPNIRKELEIFENELLANKGKMIGVQFTDEKVREGFVDEDSVYLAIADILEKKYGEKEMRIRVDGDAIYYVDGEAKKGKIFFVMHDGTISEDDIEKMIRDANRAAELRESARLSAEDAAEAEAAAERLEQAKAADKALMALMEKVARAKELKASGKLTQTVLDELKEAASKVVIKNSDSNEAKIAKVEGLRDFLEVYGFYAGGKHYDYRPIDLIVFELQTKAGFGLLGLENPSFQNGNITPYSVKEGESPIISYDYLQENNEARNIQNIIYMYLNGGLGESVKGREPVIFALNQFKNVMKAARAANDAESIEILSNMAKERDLFGRYLTTDQLASLGRYGFIQINPYDFYDESGKVKKEVVVGKKTIKVPALTGKATDTPFVVKLEDGTYEYRSIMDIKMAEMANHEGIAALQIVGPGGEANATDILKLIEAEESLLDSTFVEGALQTNGKGGGILLQERYYSWKNTGEGFSIDFDNINPGGHGTVFFTLFSSIIPNIRQMCESNGIDIKKLTRQDVEKLMEMSKELFFGNGDGLNSAPTGRVGAATMTTVPRTDVDAKGGMIVALKANVNGEEVEFPYLLERGNVSDEDKATSDALQELFARYGLKPITKAALAKEAAAYRSANNEKEAKTLERLIELFDKYGIKEMKDVKSQAFNTNGIQFNNVLMGLIFVGLMDILGEKETYQLFASPTITSDKGSYTKYEWAIGQILLWGNMNLEILRRQNPQVNELLNTILGENKTMATVVMSSPEQREEAGFTPFKFVKDILLFFKGGFINAKNKFSFNKGTKTDVLGVTGTSENNLFSVYYDWAYFDNEAESFVAKGDIAANHVIVRGKVELINESGKHVDVSPNLMRAYGLSEENGKVVLENITVRIDREGNIIVSQIGQGEVITPATVAAQETKKAVAAPTGTETQKTVINFLFKGVSKQLVFNFGTTLLSTMQDGYRKLASIENNFLSQADLKNILEDKDHYITEPVKESKGKAWELRTKDGIFIGKIITTENGNLALVTNKNKPITFKFNAMIGRSADANVSEIAYSLNKNSRKIFDLLDPNTQEHLIAAADYKFKNRILPNGDLIVRDKLVRFAVGDNVLNAENVSQTGLTAFDKAVAESVAAYRISTNYSLAEMNELLLSRTFRGYQSVQRQEMYFKVTSKTNLEYIKKGNLLRSFESAGVTTLIIQEDSYTANLEEIVKYIKDHGFEVVIEVDANNIDESKLTSLAQAGLTGIRFVVKNDVTKENIGSVVNGLSEDYKNKVLPLISNFRTIPAISYDFSNNRGRSSKLNISNEIIRTVAEFIKTNGLELVVDAKTYVETEENYIAQGKDMNNLRDFVELRDGAKIVVRVSDKDAEDAGIFDKIKKAGAVCAKTIETLKKIRVMDSLKNNARLNGRDYSLSDIFGESISELFINGGTSEDLDTIRKFLAGQEPLSLEAYNRLFSESARKAIDDVIANNNANKNDKDVLTGFARDFVIGSMTKEIESLVIPSEVRSVGDNYKVLVGSALLMMVNGVNVNDITTEANKAVIDGSKSISQLLNESGLAKSILSMWKSEDMKISIEEKADTIALAGLIKLILTMDTLLPEGESLMSSLDVSLDGIKGILAAA
ncbi:hypothetical protein [Candidatus Ruminimicrobiellum ovillum]|uniref:hypothetical protein n=1 Tax=Candidatus Ruminimicrobiellum ovillum TaxID=1947927 RepID=UPI003559AD83